ncbi:hypothetical protein FHS43_006193 [Streptosporangium becharense]|uniref:Uncharacterized protein n=1 Tax=Streptosporangium becharense TaxID=1816182 RepID=A0A7W9IGL6_9ACTN|nr:hypothetical protein [Streptosporangium becharense]MBB2914881.1 hypothetical protein [Streptosporangium becharense]MBB5820308.1 hypothetical protein [Streptosporangium becharense]
MTLAEEISALVTELGPLLDQLRVLLPEQVADAARGSMQHHKVTGSPAPWHAEAGPILMDIHEGARRLEASLRREVAGQLGERRGGSDANTVAALASIARLVHAVPEDGARRTARILSGWIRRAEEVRDIGEAERWEPLRAPAGQLPPACPYCRTFSLRVGRREGRVRCANRRCVDGDGRPPAAVIDKNRLNGDAMLVWADGRVIYYGAES